MSQRIFLFSLLIAALSSCANFSSEESSRNTQVVRHNAPTIWCEIVGVNGDSLIIEPQDGSALYFPIHYADIDRVVLRNEASKTFAILLGSVTGGIAGFYIGGAYGEANGTGDFKGVSEALGGFVIGALAGGIAAGHLSDDKAFEIRTPDDLQPLASYARHKDAYALKLARGY